MESWDDFDGSLAGRAHGDGMDDGGLLSSGRRRGAPATRRAAPPSGFDDDDGASAVSACSVSYTHLTLPTKA